MLRPAQRQLREKREAQVGAMRLVLLALLSLVALPQQPASAQQPAPAQQPAAPTESMAQSTTTEADMADAQARAHFRLGKEYYDQGRFADAAKEFEVAYGLSGRGSLLYNVYLAYRDAQDTANSARALRGYLAAVPDAADREHLTARLAAIDATLKLAEADAERQRAESEAAQRKTEQAERERAESERRAVLAEQRAEVRPERPLWPWFLVGGGILTAGGGVVLGVITSGDADDLRGECVEDPRNEGAMVPLREGNFCAPGVDVEGRRDSIQTRALVADALWIGGGVIAVTGLVLAFALPDEYPEEQPVTASCSTHACQASLRLSF
jgi:tetratricopeptide (TPR) repeat protein